MGQGIQVTGALYIVQPSRVQFSQFAIARDRPAEVGVTWGYVPAHKAEATTLGTRVLM